MKERWRDKVGNKGDKVGNKGDKDNGMTYL